MKNDPIVIVSLARTPIGNLLGELKDVAAHELGTIVIKAALQRANLGNEDIDEVLLGCVLPAGQGQAPARQAALRAGLNEHTPCTTVNKVCGSSMKTVMLAHDMITTGSANIVLAGGMESMSNAPYLLLKARQGYRLGANTIYDHMMLDGLEDAYDKGQAMGTFAESCVKQYGFSRKEQDDYSIESMQKARFAIEHHLFKDEIAPVIIKTKDGEKIIDQDERPFSVNPEKIPSLKAAFAKEGTVTAGNSSSIADGAAALILMTQSHAEKLKLKPIAIMVGHATVAKKPSEFTTAPIDATRKLLSNIHWQISDVDLFEVNEAFAVVALAFMRDLKVSRDKVNVHGGACALGHPIGASGARIMTTLLSVLKQQNKKRGLATLCIGGGEATAVAFEMC